MQARWLMGHARRNEASWKKTGGARPTSVLTLHPFDVKALERELTSCGAKRLLEFGPGESTEVFLKFGVQVTTIEHHERWYLVAKERFGDRARVLKGEDEMPFLCPELGDEQFDIAFVDAPQGFFPARKIHKGYEDCSRFNTAMFALEHAPIVLLHDATRPLERGTLNRLSLMGYKVEFIKVPYGLARITHGDQKRFDLPGTKKPRRSAAGGSTGQRHRRSSKRSGGRPPSGDGEA